MSKAVVLAFSLILLGFCVACGGGGSNTSPEVAQHGAFSDASLKGQYTYYLTGTIVASGTKFSEAGVFTADGHENLSRGIDDLNQSNGQSQFAIQTFGNYAINKNGIGTVTLNRLPPGQGTITLAVTMITASQIYLVGADGLTNSFGVATRQGSSTFASPSGAFAFHLHSNRPAGVATIGAITVDGGQVTGGSEDQNLGGAVKSLTLTGGTFDPPDSTGRGTGSLIDSDLSTLRFFYYVIDANTINFLPQDSNVIGVGRVEKQSGTFTNGSLFGDYAFGSRGDTALDGVRTVGRFYSDGAGNLSFGAFDSVRDGATARGTFNTGTYTTMSPDGRTAVVLNSSSGTILEVFRMVSAQRAFFLINDGTKVEDGTMDAQTVNTFSNSTINGQFSFVMDGLDLNGLVDYIGTAGWSGTGKLSLTQVANRQGVVKSPTSLSGSYSVASNGRVAAKVDGISGALVFYLISGSDGYLLQSDPFAEVDGSMRLQH